MGAFTGSSATLITPREVVISTTGANGGNIDIFVGSSAIYGDDSKNLDPTQYPLSSTAADSNETITVNGTSVPDLATLSAGGFITLLVVERNLNVEEYSISLSCSSS